jgi:hypothetical protein
VRVDFLGLGRAKGHLIACLILFFVRFGRSVGLLDLVGWMGGLWIV